MRRSPQAQQLVFRLPPYDTPHNNPEFHIYRTYAGGVLEQTKTALPIYIYI